MNCHYYNYVFDDHVTQLHADGDVTHPKQTEIIADVYKPMETFHSSYWTDFDACSKSFSLSKNGVASAVVGFANANSI